MPNNATSTNNSNTPTYPSTQTSQQSTQSGSNRKTLIYILVGVMLVLILAAAYFTLFSGPSTPPNQNIYSNLSSANLTPGQHAFYVDLAKAANVSSIGVTYFAGNYTNATISPGGAPLVSTTQQIITAYRSGADNASELLTTVTYFDAASNSIVGTNSSDVYFYNTTQGTVTCINETTSAGIIRNGNLTCTFGDGGLGYLRSFPFEITNVTALGYLGTGSVTYSGPSTMIGRACDDFLVSNLISPSASNYSQVSLCMDEQYGIPLYFNETDYSNGVPSQGLLLVAQNISSNVPASAVSIPAAYESSAQNDSSFI